MARHPRRHPIEAMVDAAVRCTLCGARGLRSCDCWAKCQCGWLYESGTDCRNEVHRCTYLEPDGKRCVWPETGDGRCNEHRAVPHGRNRMARGMTKAARAARDARLTELRTAWANGKATPNEVFLLEFIARLENRLETTHEVLDHREETLSSVKGLVRKVTEKVGDIRRR
jgi:hypothetical protein